ncbi:MAG TPA: metallophosphoesterase [Gemmatimonadaceae bacterium]|nr:metallophosphoesterase [Gemmatimonadaceae bacterium]
MSCAARDHSRSHRAASATRFAYASYLLLAAVACSSPTESPPVAHARPGTVSGAVAAPTPAVLVGAGDIAGCASSGDEATARLLARYSGTVFTAGDNAYEAGSAADYANCYGPSWGRQKWRTRPAPGNHEYHTAGAAAYFAYFGAAAGRAGAGWYSYDLKDWHVVVLNSNVSMSATSPQVAWLKADLAAHRKRCTLVYWHHPLFSSGPHGSNAFVRPVWQVLYQMGVDVVVNGHDHDYERFAPQRPDGTWDPQRGIREFVVGLGGRSRYSFVTVRRNSQARYNARFGVIVLSLFPTSYHWAFLGTDALVKDSGVANCH